ncbi:CST complex subunit Ten1 [Elsinoe ampelina]|uniref:CST complex subunit Ten1 n=1 Tax=Elsinoe ampelina TaxID=302913 RepID=A0A6A6GDU4_9PEZI|nr:CST complex subunit Ten1 [Elsinoe ampelina]
MNARSNGNEARTTDRAQPSQLVFLHELQGLPMRTKVRFLGCIERFEVGSDTALVSYRSTTQQSTVVASVNFVALLGTPSLSLDVGSWVNIMGYVTDGSVRGSEDSRQVYERVTPVAHVQALMAWDAGDLNLDDYERALRAKCGGRGGY